MVLTEIAYPGLHDYLMKVVPVPFGENKALDLGAGSGALSARLLDAGWDAVAVDANADAYMGPARFNSWDLNSQLQDDSQYQLITAVEVIEHLERPIALLRTIASLLAPGGVAIVTTPNVDSIVARLSR